MAIKTIEQIGKQYILHDGQWHIPVLTTKRDVKLACGELVEYGAASLKSEPFGRVCHYCAAYFDKEPLWDKLQRVAVKIDAEQAALNAGGVVQLRLEGL